MADANAYQLFIDALDVINRSLAANRDKGVWGKLIGAFDKYIDGHHSAVAVYDENPSAPFAYYTIRYLGGRFELVQQGKGEYDTEWKVSRDYLKSVVDDPQKYIDHPAMLDLDWLKSILPDKAASLFAKVA
jgi:hypothetical protein